MNSIRYISPKSFRTPFGTFISDGWRRRICSRLLCCLLLLCLYPSLLGDTGKEGTDKVDKYLQKEMEKRGIPGMAIAVLVQGKPVKVKTYGYANLEKKEAVELDTSFDIGSVSKSFVSAAILMLIEQGRLSLDSPVSQFIANTPATWHKMTVRHLLSHSSGIKDYIREIPASNIEHEWTDSELYGRAAVQKLHFPPGEQFRYSHTNYLLLGMIIRSVTGKKFHSYITENLFLPLKMTHTFARSEEKTVKLAVGYRKEEDKTVVEPRENRTFADAFCSSTIQDLIVWAEALERENPQRGTPLSNAARARMWAPNVAKDGKTAIHGYGWYIENLQEQKVVGHGGTSGGHSANISRFPDAKITVIVLANQKDSQLFGIVRGIAAHYITDLKEK